MNGIWGKVDIGNTLVDEWRGGAIPVMSQCLFSLQKKASCAPKAVHQPDTHKPLKNVCMYLQEQSSIQGHFPVVSMSMYLYSKIVCIDIMQPEPPQLRIEHNLHPSASTQSICSF